MNKKTILILAIVAVIVTTISFFYFRGHSIQQISYQSQLEPVVAGEKVQAAVASSLMPGDLTYIGSFRVPHYSGSGSDQNNWAYGGGRALGFNPLGDPSNSDAYPGSLFSNGHDYYGRAAEISIPTPVISSNLSQLPIATTLQNFGDITGSYYAGFSGQIVRFGDILYLPKQGSQASDKLYWTIRDMYNVNDEDKRGHGWSDLSMSTPNARGLWHVGPISNFDPNSPYHYLKSSDYLMEIPSGWTANVGGKKIASGMGDRENGTQGASKGPALYAIAPWQDGNPPANGTDLATQILLYYNAAHPSQNYSGTDQWTDGAWVDFGGKTAVIFAGNKCTSTTHYFDDCGNSSCNNDPGYCHENKGYVCDGPYQAQVLFYNPNDLAAVAQGSKQPWEPVPYTVMNLTPYIVSQCQTSIEGVAYDSTNGILYVSQTGVDTSQSSFDVLPIIHVFKITGGTAPFCGDGVCNGSETSTSCPVDCPASLCGNGQINSGEQCDGSNLNSQSCSSLGYAGGTLSCSSSCQFNTSGCVAQICGNGIIEGTEACDDGDSSGGDGCSASCAVESGYSCTGQPSICTLNQTASNNCDPLPASTGTVVNVSTVSGLVNAINNAATGSVIKIADGTYNLGGQGLVINTANVKVRSTSGNRDAVILDGQYQGGNIFTVNAAGVTIADMTLKRSVWHPVQVKGPGQNVMLYNLKVLDAGQQYIKVTSDNGQFADGGTLACSYLQMNTEGRTYVESQGACYTGGIDAHSTQNWTVRDNIIRDIYCNNGQIAEHAIHFWKENRDTTVERNLIINDARGIGFGLTNGSTNYRTYSDNPLSGSGLTMSQVDHIGGIIKNNIIYGNIGNKFDTGIGLESAYNVSVYNNTVYAGYSGALGIDLRYTGTRNTRIANNLYNPGLNIRDSAATPVQNLTNLSASSGMFVNMSGENLHLASTASTAINHGSSVGVTLDFDRQTRDSQPDIGADEYVTGSGSVCGNGIREGSEQCDGSSLNGQSCSSLGYAGGSLSCSSSCTFVTTQCTYCGNGTIQSGEQCDGSNLNGQSCSGLGYAGGSLSCNSSCQFNTVQCIAQICGNGQIEPGEQCDGTNLGSQSCSSFGYAGGSLSCSSSCQLVTSACVNNICGNGVIETGEQCDGSNLNGQSCSSRGFSGGTLSCNSSCQFNTAQCTPVTTPVCGNGVIESGEACDGTALGGQACTDFGFAGGALSCSSSCQFVTSSCQSNICGNGVIETGEQCDGSNLNSQSCSSRGFNSGTLSCGSTCQFNSSQCSNITNTAGGNTGGGTSGGGASGTPPAGNSGRGTSGNSPDAGRLIAIANQSGAAVYYIGRDGRKYVFPDAKTYYTWYPNFNAVEKVSVSVLDSYPDGGAMPYRSGTNLITHQDTVKVYAVGPGGVLHWIKDEQTAKNLYGVNWASRVRDVIPGFFVTSYVVGEDLGSVYLDGTLIQQGADIFYISGNQRRRFASISAFFANGFNTDHIVLVNSVAAYQEGSPITGLEAALSKY